MEKIKIEDAEDAKIENKKLVDSIEKRRKEIEGRKTKLGCGFHTLRAIEHWKNTFKGKFEDKKKKDLEKGNVESLIADPDPSKPLYFWQLVSLIGDDRIFDLIVDFYNRIYNDKREEVKWFRKVFEDIASARHHSVIQYHFWKDSMGGGNIYMGGEGRLNYHHRTNAMQLMNENGAVLWMSYMRQALDAADLTDDPRVRPCIEDFLYVMMEKYSKDFGFKTGVNVYGEKWAKRYTASSSIVKGMNELKISSGSSKSVK